MSETFHAVTQSSGLRDLHSSVRVSLHSSFIESPCSVAHSRSNVCKFFFFYQTVIKFKRMRTQPGTVSPCPKCTCVNTHAKRNKHKQLSALKWINWAFQQICINHQQHGYVDKNNIYMNFNNYIYMWYIYNVYVQLLIYTWTYMCIYIYIWILVIAYINSE